MFDKQEIKQLKEIFATKSDLKPFATKDDFKNFATKTDLKNFATKTDLKNFATKNDLKNFATKNDLKSFATKNDLKSLATKKDIAGVKGIIKKEIDNVAILVNNAFNTNEKRMTDGFNSVKAEFKAEFKIINEKLDTKTEGLERRMAVVEDALAIE
jgi:hypothetical protein